MNPLRCLKAESDLLVQNVDAHPLLRELFSGTVGGLEYAFFLARSHRYIRWTSVLLRAAAANPSQSIFTPLLVEKSKEEQGHERWIEADLARLGLKATLVCPADDVPALDAYVAYHRAAVAGPHPAGFLGAAYLLEKLSVERATLAVDKFRTRADAPRFARALRFLRGHAEADLGHAAHLDAVFDVDLAEPEAEAIIFSARLTRLLYARFFDGFHEHDDLTSIRKGDSHVAA